MPVVSGQVTFGARLPRQRVPDLSGRHHAREWRAVTTGGASGPMKVAATIPLLAGIGTTDLLMVERFYRAEWIFHAGVLVVTLWLGWRWWQRTAPRPGSGNGGARSSATAPGSHSRSCNGHHRHRSRARPPLRAGAPVLCQAILEKVYTARLDPGAPPPVPPGLGRWPAAVVAVVLLLVYVEAYHRCPHNIQVRRHTVNLYIGALGRARCTYLHLSDFQTDWIGPHERRAIRLAKEQRADLIVWTGDYIQERLAPTYDRAAADFGALLRREEIYGAPRPARGGR